MCVPYKYSIELLYIFLWKKEFHGKCINTPNGVLFLLQIQWKLADLFFFFCPQSFSQNELARSCFFFWLNRKCEKVHMGLLKTSVVCNFIRATKRVCVFTLKEGKKHRTNTPLSWSSNAKRIHRSVSDLKFQTKMHNAHLLSVYINSMWKSLRILHIEICWALHNKKDEKKREHTKEIRIENVYFIRIVCTFTQC